jgi:putative flippase GtrA
MKKIIASPIVRMIIVGALSVTLAYTTFLFLIKIGIHYQIASIANFVTYWVINFFLNKTWAFKSTGNIKKEALAHASLHLGNQVMIMIGLYFLIEQVGIYAAWSQIIMQVIATITAFAITPIIFKNK